MHEPAEHFTAVIGMTTEEEAEHIHMTGTVPEGHVSVTITCTCGREITCEGVTVRTVKAHAAVRFGAHLTVAGSR